MKSVEIAIVGGGAAGLMAAIAAAESGCRSVTILERNRACGAKILLSGGGRCNLTNVNASAEHYSGGSRPFVRNVLAAFGRDETMRFFESIGVALTEEEGGRIFPASGHARDVLDALLHRTKALGVTIHTDARARTIRRTAEGFVISMPPRELLAKRVILAAGGASHPKSGSDGSGFLFARSFGHTVVEPVPALAPLVIAELWVHRLAGLTIDVQLEIAAGDKAVACAAGSVVFTHAGVSGPAALNVSREVARRAGPSATASPEACRAEQKLTLHFNALPGRRSQELREGLQAFRAAHPAALLITFFRELLPDRLCEALLRHGGQHPGTRLRELSAAGLTRAISAVTAARLTVKGTGGFDEAHATAGGVALNEVRFQTLESRLVPGLFFAGEILDVDGESGGYNLQWAWSTGAIAGRAAASNP